MDITQAREAVMKHAASDANFRTFALQNGAGAIGTLAEGEVVNFTEADLPAGSEGGELSDEALDSAAGGSSTGTLYGSSYYCGPGSPSGRR